MMLRMLMLLPLMPQLEARIRLHPPLLLLLLRLERFACKLYHGMFGVQLIIGERATRVELHLQPLRRSHSSSVQQRRSLPPMPRPPATLRSSSWRCGSARRPCDPPLRYCSPHCCGQAAPRLPSPRRCSFCRPLRRLPLLQRRTQCSSWRVQRTRQRRQTRKATHESLLREH